MELIQKLAYLMFSLPSLSSALVFLLRKIILWFSLFVKTLQKKIFAWLNSLIGFLFLTIDRVAIMRIKAMYKSATKVTSFILMIQFVIRGIKLLTTWNWFLRYFALRKAFWWVFWFLFELFLIFFLGFSSLFYIRLQTHFVFLHFFFFFGEWRDIVIFNDVFQKTLLLMFWKVFNYLFYLW